MPPFSRKLWATSADVCAVTVGAIVALAVVTATLATIGIGLGFLAIWTCVTAHNQDPGATGCSRVDMGVRLALVVALCFVPGWPVFVATKHWVLHRIGGP